MRKEPKTEGKGEKLQMNIDDGVRTHRRQDPGRRAGVDKLDLKSYFPVRAGCQQEFGRDTDSTSQLYYYQVIVAKIDY